MYHPVGILSEIIFTWEKIMMKVGSLVKTNASLKSDYPEPILHYIVVSLIVKPSPTVNI